MMRLFLLLASLTGVCPLGSKVINSRAGEIVALHCPNIREYNPSETEPIWTGHTTQEMFVSNNMSSAELTQMGVLVSGGSLVILNASVNHQGNYSCSVRNASNRVWFKLTVNQPHSREYDEKHKYSKTCYTQESCKLNCPDVNIPAKNTPNITTKNTTWYKNGESLPKNGYFSSVEEKDHGVYMCERSYLYHGKTYNKTFTVVLTVKPKKVRKTAVIISPKKNDVITVDLGSTLVIDCKAVAYSKFDGVFWLMGKSFVERNTSFPVFYNYTREQKAEETKLTASLIFRKVSKEDLSKNYTCKMESSYQPPSFVTITLAQKTHPSHTSLVLIIMGIMLIMIVTVFIYVNWKIDIALFLRDTLGCHSSRCDGKRYDAFLICYKSDTDAGLSVNDRRWLESVLEEKFGYSLCLYDREVLPGIAEAEAVLDCIQQSRAVVLVPNSQDSGPGSGLLSAIHAAHVERQTRLIFIKTQTTEASTSGSLDEALHLLTETGDCVTWKGLSSMPASSSFWKRLRYYLPVPQHSQEISLLPQTANKDDNC